MRSSLTLPMLAVLATTATAQFGRPAPRYCEDNTQATCSCPGNTGNPGKPCFTDDKERPNCFQASFQYSCEDQSTPKSRPPLVCQEDTSIVCTCNTKAGGDCTASLPPSLTGKEEVRQAGPLGFRRPVGPRTRPPCRPDQMELSCPDGSSPRMSYR